MGPVCAARNEIAMIFSCISVWLTDVTLFSLIEIKMFVLSMSNLYLGVKVKANFIPFMKICIYLVIASTIKQ